MGVKKEKFKRTQRRALSQSPTTAGLRSSSRHNPGRIGPRSSPCRSRADHWRTRASEDSDFSLKSKCPGHCFDNVLPRTFPYRSHADISKNNVCTSAAIKPSRRHRAYSASERRSPSKPQRYFTRSRSSSSDSSPASLPNAGKFTTSARDRGDVSRALKRPCILCKPWRHCTMCSPPDRHKHSRAGTKRRDLNKSEVRDNLNKCESWNPSAPPRIACSDPNCRPWKPCRVCKIIKPCDPYPLKYNTHDKTSSNYYSSCPKYRGSTYCSTTGCKPRSFYPCSPRSCDPCLPRSTCDPCTPRSCNPCRPTPRSSCKPCHPKSCDPCVPRSCSPCTDSCPPRSCKPCPTKSCDPCKPRSCSPRSCSPCSPKYCSPSPRSCSPCSPQTCSPRKPFCDPCKTPCDTSCNQKSLKTGPIECDTFSKVYCPAKPTTSSRPLSCSPKCKNPSRLSGEPRCIVCASKPCQCSAKASVENSGTSGNVTMNKYDCEAACPTHLCPWEADVTVSGTVRGHCNATVAEVARRLTGHFHCSGQKMSKPVSSCNDGCSPCEPASLRLSGFKDGTTLNFSSNKCLTSERSSIPEVSSHYQKEIGRNTDSPRTKALPPSPINCQLPKTHAVDISSRNDNYSENKTKQEVHQRRRCQTGSVENAARSSKYDKTSNFDNEANDLVIDLQRVPSSVKSDASSQRRRERNTYSQNVSFKGETHEKVNYPHRSNQSHTANQVSSKDDSYGNYRWKPKQSEWEPKRNGVGENYPNHQYRKEHSRHRHGKASAGHLQEGSDNGGSYCRHHTEPECHDKKARNFSKNHRGGSEYEGDSTRKYSYLKSKHDNEYYNQYRS